MGIVKRQASKSTITSLVGIVFSAISSLFIIPMVATETYGLLALVLSLSALTLPLALMGLNNTVPRFYNNYKTPQDQTRFFGYLYRAQTFISIVTCLAFYLIAPFIFERFYPDSTTLANQRLSITILIFVMAQFSMLSSYSISIYRLNVVRILEVFFQKLGIAFVLLLVALAVLPESYLIPVVVGLFILRAAGIMYFWRSNSKGIIPNQSVAIDRKEIASYGLFAVLSVVLHQAVIEIDTMMVGSMISVSEAGVYKYAFYVAMLVDLPRVNLSSILFPLISKYQHSGEVDKVNDVYKRSSNLLFLAGCFLLLVVWPNLDNFFQVIPNGENFVHAKYVIIFISLAKVINMAMGINVEILASTKKYHLILVINLISLILVLISNKLLIPVYGANGAALATLIVWIAYNICAFLFLKVLYKLNPFSLNTLKLTGITTATMIVLFMVPDVSSNHWLNMIVRGICTLPFLWIMYRLKISIDFNDLLDKVLSKVRK